MFASSKSLLRARAEELPGTDARVERFVLEKDETVEFLAKAKDLLLFTLPRCEREGRATSRSPSGAPAGAIAPSSSRRRWQKR